jgi:DNA replication protein DnaC
MTQATRQIDTLAQDLSSLSRLSPHSDQYKRMKDWYTSHEWDLLRDPEADPYEVAFTYEWVCPHCGELTPPQRFLPDPFGRQGRGMWIRPTSHGCTEEREHQQETALEEAERKNAEAAERWRRRLEQAGLVGKLATATFDNYEARDNWPEALTLKNRVREYADDLLAGRLEPGHNWLVLAGPVGTGKSHLAAAVVRAALRDGKQAYFREWTTYLQRITTSWDKRDDPNAERESEILAELDQGWLVVIDDLDKRRSTEWVKGTLFSFLNNRYNAQLPTIITLNTPMDALDPKAPGRLALHDLMGGAVLDRTIESLWDYLEFNGPSFRSGKRWDN